MAKTQTPFLSFFFFFFLSLLLSSIFIHISPALAIRPKHQKPKKQVFSVSLHPVDSITNPQRQSNPAIIPESQIDEDLARAEYTNSRIRRAISHCYSNSNSSCQSFETEDLQAPITITSGGGGYAARIGVGTPATEFYLLADTGSDVTWLQCSAAQGAFDPSVSSSFQHLFCSSQQCGQLEGSGKCGAGGTCAFELRYGDKSVTDGELATDTLSFGDSGSVPNVAIGCSTDSEGEAGIAGILGLGGSQLGLPSQSKATSFSYCLADGSGSSTLDFNSAPPGDSVTVPLLRNQYIDTYYYVELTGITIGVDRISIPASVYQIGSDGKGGIIVDSGTTLTLLDPAVYSMVRDTFRKYIQASPGSFRSWETCYDVPSGSPSDINPPAMSFQFSNGETLTLLPENYLPAVGQSTRLCFPFGATDQIVSIIGNKVHKGMRVTYDLGNNVIGFSPNKC